MRNIFLVGVAGAAAAAMSGCASVEVRYDKPADFDHVADAAAQAKDGLAYFALQKIHVAVEPIEGATAPESDEDPDAKPADRPAAAPAKPRVVAGDKAAKDKAAIKDGAEPKDKATAKDKKEEQKPATATETPEKPEKPAPQKGAEEVAKPVKVIDGKTWGATLTVVPDPAHAFMMGGTNGFWKKTSITGERIANSDQVSSVSVKAENLTAKRLGQIATVLGYFIKPDPAAAANAAAARGEPLKPFEFDVDVDKFSDPQKPNYTRVPGTGEWFWSLRGSADLPGVVSFSKFISTAKPAKKVNYFPVPACLPAELVISKAVLSGNQTSYEDKAAFPLVLATGERVRLEPLPLDGKLTLSKICSGTVEGATQTDRYDEVFANLAALQAEYEKLKKKKEGEQEAEGATEDGGEDGADGGKTPTDKK